MQWIGRKDRVKMDDKSNEKVNEIENMRKELHELIDERCNQLIVAVLGGEVKLESTLVLPLSYTPSYFKGKKPIAIEFSDGREIETPTWKKVVTAIMQDCNSTEQGYKNLRAISGKVSGKQRLLLDANPNEMDVPLKIDEDLFLEGKFDTESLIRVMNKLVLDVVGYDYGKVNVKIRNPIAIARELAEQVKNTEEAMDEEMNGPTIRM